MKMNHLMKRLLSAVCVLSLLAGVLCFPAAADWIGAAGSYDYASYQAEDNYDASGYWAGVRALDYVTLPEDFDHLTVQESEVEPTEEDITNTIDVLRAMLAQDGKLPELTDAWVKKNLGDAEGVYTVAQLRETMRETLRHQNLRQAVVRQLVERSEFKGCPDIILNSKVCELLLYYNNMAAAAGITVEQLVQQYTDYADIDAVLKASENALLNSACEELVIQAAAEKLGIAMTDESMKPYGELASVKQVRAQLMADTVVEALCEDAGIA